MRRYSPEFIARVKAALNFGFPVKVLSRLVDVPAWTLVEWKREDSRATVEPNPEAIEEMRLAIKKES